jgi:hypothetical protein
MNDSNNLVIQQQTRNLLLQTGGAGGSGGMNIGGANQHSMEPLSLEGLLPVLTQVLNSGCGVVQLAASLAGIKGVDRTQILQQLDSLGLFKQFVPSIAADFFKNAPNIFGVRQY